MLFFSTKKEKAEFVEKLWVIWHCRLHSPCSEKPKPLIPLGNFFRTLISRDKKVRAWTKSFWVQFKRKIFARIKHEIFTYMPIGCKGDMVGHSRGYRFCYRWNTKLCDLMEGYWRGVLD